VQRFVVDPGQVRPHPVVGADRDVAGLALVGAGGAGRAVLQQILGDVGDGQVPADRQAGLEQRPRPGRLRDDPIADENPDVSRGVENLDAMVRVAGVPRHRLVLLPPGLHGGQVEGDQSGQLGHLRLREHPPGFLGDPVADRHAVVHGLPLAGAVGAPPVRLEQVHPDVGDREVEHRKLAVLVQHPGGGAVHHGHVADRAADPRQERLEEQQAGGLRHRPVERARRPGTERGGAVGQGHRGEDMPITGIPRTSGPGSGTAAPRRTACRAAAGHRCRGCDRESETPACGT